MPRAGGEGGKERSRLGDTIFSVVHLIGIAAVFVYGMVALVQRNLPRFGIVMGGLALYYFLILHTPVTREIARKRAARRRP